MSALLAPRAALWVVNQSLPFSKKWNVNVWGAGRVYLGTSAAPRVNQGNISTVALPEARRCWTAAAVLWQPARAREPCWPRMSGSQPDPRRVAHRGTAPQHPQGVPPKKAGWSVGQNNHPKHILIFIQQTFVSKPSAAGPGARTCLGGLILLSLALVSVISSLGFSGTSHYLPYCERSSNTEEVFSFPLEFCLGHCLAARQNYQSLLPKALLSGLEILSCWRSGDLRYIGRALYLQLALFWVLASAITLLPKRNSYYGIDFLPQKKPRESDF